MDYVMIWDSVERILFGIAIAVAFMCGLQYLKKAREREDFNEKVMLYGLTALILISATGLFFWILSDFYFEGIYINGTFRGDVKSDTITYFLIHEIGSVLLVLGPFMFILAFEIIVKRTRYILTIINTVFGVVLIFAPEEIYKITLSYIVSPLSLIMVVIIFLLYAKWSQYEFKAISSLLLLGFVIIWIGLDLWSSSVKVIDTIPLFISPLFVLTGYLISISPILIDPTHFSRAKVYWLSVGSIIVVISWILLFVMINAGLSEFNTIIEFLIIISLATFMVFYSIRVISSQQTIDKKAVAPNILKVFEKPERVTEEEITFSIEKKTCLVCKGKISRSNYMYPECGALYCKKCSDALVDVENICWVCETPFDTSMPIKKTEPKETREGIEILSDKW